MFSFLKSKNTFNAIFSLTASLARNQYFSFLTHPFMRLLAFATLKIRKGKKQETADAVAKEWQKMFPGGHKTMPITEVKGDIVQAEIRIKCPLRGTGDVRACHRMMEYDRAMVKKMGGEFVVLESQSNSGNEFCKVAIKKKS